VLYSSAKFSSLVFTWLVGSWFAGVKGASTQAKGASKVGFKPIYYFLV
jgi:hypothetical protein